MQDDKHKEEEFSYKNYFGHLTKSNVITWIVVIGFIVYGNMLFNGFAGDDTAYILQNAEIHILNIPYFFGQTLFNNTGQYRALIELYYAIIYSVFSNTAFIYHTVQLILHLSNCFFVYYLFKKFFKPSLAFILALVFLVHPMQVESVSYISAADSVVTFIFGILAVLILGKKTLRIRDYFIVTLLFLASLLTKEIGLLFIIVGVLYVYLFNKKYIRQSVLVSVGTIIVYCIFRFWIGGVFFGGRTLIPIAQLSFTQRLLNIPAIFFFYIKTFIFPRYLLVNQQWTVTSLNFSNFYLPLVILLVVTVFLSFYLIKTIKKHNKDSNTFIFFLSWSVIGFGLYAQIYPLDMTVADRWMYFPIVGLLGLIGCFVKSLIENKKNIMQVTVVSIIIICLFSIRTIIRNTNWLNSLTLYAHDTKYDTNFFIENDYAQELVTSGDYKDALTHEKKSVNFFPYEINLLNLADIYALVGNNNEAGIYFKEALNSSAYIQWNYKHIINTYIDYAKLLLVEGNTNQASLIINDGLRDYNYKDSPYIGYLWILRAIVDYKQHNFEDGLQSAQHAYNFLPNQATSVLYSQLSNHRYVNVQAYLSIIPL